MAQMVECRSRRRRRSSSGRGNLSFPGPQTRVERWRGKRDGALCKRTLQYDLAADPVEPKQKKNGTGKRLVMDEFTAQAVFNPFMPNVLNLVH